MTEDEKILQAEFENDGNAVRRKQAVSTAVSSPCVWHRCFTHRIFLLWDWTYGTSSLSWALVWSLMCWLV